MTNIDRVRVAFTGFPGAPGVATHFGSSGPALYPVVHALWSALSTAIPNDVTITVEPFGDTVDDTTGNLTGSWSIAAGTVIQGTDGGVYSAPSGLAMTWLTDTILDHHRVRGRTFVVPLSQSSYSRSGSIEAVVLAGIVTVASDYVKNTAGNALVWHRPRAAKAADSSHPAVTARVGGHAVITGSRVANKVAVLRSRRD